MVVVGGRALVLFIGVFALNFCLHLRTDGKAALALLLLKQIVSISGVAGFDEFCGVCVVFL